MTFSAFSWASVDRGTRRRGTFAVAAALALGLLHIVAQSVVVGREAWGTELVQDPGKVLFHVAMLPIGILVFLLGDLGGALAALWREWRKVALVGLGIVFLGVSGGTWNASYDEVCQRPAVSALRECKLANVPNLNVCSTPESAPAGCCASPHSLTCFRALKAYWNVCKGSKCDAVANDFRSVRVGCVTSCDWVAQASLAAWTSALLSWAAAMFGGLSILAALSVAALFPTPSAKQKEGLLKILLLFVLWLAARAYSEWHASAGSPEFAEYYPAVPAAFCIAIMGALILWIVVRNDSNFTKWGVPFVGTVTAAITAIAVLKPDLFDAAARSFAHQRPSGLLICYVLIASVLLVGLVPLSGVRR
jgi:hypothetical protein